METYERQAEFICIEPLTEQKIKVGSSVFVTHTIGDTVFLVNDKNKVHWGYNTDFNLSFNIFKKHFATKNEYLKEIRRKKLIKLTL